MGDLAAYAFELTQPDAEALYTHVDVGFEDQAVIQGAPRARAASPASTSSTAMNEMELLEKGRLWASRRDLADGVNHFALRTQPEQEHDVREGGQRRGQVPRPQMRLRRGRQGQAQERRDVQRQGQCERNS